MAWKSAPDGEAAHLPFHSGVGQVQHGLGQLVFGQLGLVVDKDGGAGGDAGPLARGGAELGRNLVEGGLVHVGEQAGVFDLRHRRGVFGEEHVGRRGCAFLDDLVGQFGVRALAHGHLDAGFRREGFDPFLGEAFVLGVVDRDLAGGGSGRGGRGAGGGRGGGAAAGGQSEGCGGGECDAGQGAVADLH